LAAANEAGLVENSDFNGAQQEGVGGYQLTQRNGLRCSAALAYLHPASQRPNLTIISAGFATRILFDKKRAVGVEIARDAGLEVVMADREVLLAAGGYGSPQLLLLSGIGPADDLKMLQIEVRENLPVGHNLQDHPVAGITLFTDVETLFTALKPENIELLQKEGRGPPTSNIAEAGGFARTAAPFRARHPVLLRARDVL
jgi:choline dehydrogenase-like flavoprotein